MRKKWSRRRLAGVVALMALAGCGRKGGLEMPPREDTPDKRDAPAAESETVE